MEKGGTAAVTGRHPKRTQHTGQAQRESIASVTMMTVMTMNVTYTLIMVYLQNIVIIVITVIAGGKGLFNFSQEVAVFASIAFGYPPNANLLGKSPIPRPSLTV